MSKGQVVTEFEWLAGSSGDDGQPSVGTTNFQFLKEGYLNMIEEETDHVPHGIYSTSLPRYPTAGGPVMGGAHAVLVRRTSDPTIKGTWRRRWCVLSQTADGVHLLYYKHQHSFTNCEPPLGVVLMEGCQKLYTIPSHSKSSNVFAVAFYYRIIMFYPDKGSELQGWLEAFQAALNMKDASTSSPLKGLPKQKALRKDFHMQPWPRGHEISCSDKQKKTAADQGAEALSFRMRSLSIETDEATNPIQSVERSPTPELKGLPKKKALHTRHKSPKEKKLYEDVLVPDLDSEEKGAVQFLGFRMLDT